MAPPGGPPHTAPGSKPRPGLATVENPASDNPEMAALGIDGSCAGGCSASPYALGCSTAPSASGLECSGGALRRSASERERRRFGSTAVVWGLGFGF